jgi:hypothetical protein
LRSSRVAEIAELDASARFGNNGPTWEHLVDPLPRPVRAENNSGPIMPSPHDEFDELVEKIADIDESRLDYQGVHVDSQHTIYLLIKIYRLLNSTSRGFLIGAPLANAVNQARLTLNAITKFTPERRSSAGLNIGETQNEIQNLYDEACSRLLPLIGASHPEANEGEDLLRKIRERYDESQRLLTLIGEMVTDAAVRRHSGIFSGQADKYELAADWWLRATVKAGLATLAAPLLLFTIYFCLYIFGVTPPTATQSLELTASGVAAFSVLYFALLVCSRIYRSNVHNAAVNRHRANSLGTFEAFIASAGDSQTKDAVLIQAAQSIFAPQATGFSPAGESDAGSPQILEILRGTLGGDKKP